jgi:hypothetical protein
MSDLGYSIVEMRFIRGNDPLELGGQIVRFKRF